MANTREIQLLFALVALLASVHAVYGAGAYDEVRLSDVSVLLPFNPLVSHTLEAFNGCFDWRASNPTIVRLEVLDDCGKKVRVRAQSSDTMRPSRSWLFATDRATGRPLKCELLLDRIAKIEVLTTTRTMHKDDIERLEIQAFDKAGNKFSTVEGLYFEWGIQQLKAQAATSILQIHPFNNSVIETSELLKSIEEQGKQSSAVLVRGVQTGKVLLTARLLETSVAVDSAQLENKVEIAVIESLVMEPSQDIYVATQQQVQFVLQTFKNGFQAVQMPNEKFVWTSSNTTVATVSNTGLVMSLNYGSTNITCAFVDMPENNAQVNLFVVEPSYLGLEVSEIFSGNQSTIVKGLNVHNWFLVHGQNYQVKVQVFDQETHKFYTTDGLEFAVDYSVEHIGVLTGQMAKNRASYNATMLKLGECDLQVTLTTNEANIKVRTPVTIVPPVKIQPARQVLLPLDSSVKHQFTLKSTGGRADHHHIWTSSNVSRVVVNAAGIIIGESEGSANIRCQDSSNPNNYDTIAASVAVPKSIKIVPGPLELTLNGTLPLVVRLFDENGTPFDNCSALPLDWAIGDDTIVAFGDVPQELLSSHHIEGACGVRILRGLKEGSVMVTIRYNHLSVSTLVSVFQELQLSQGVAVVTLGSSVTVGISGGPSPWAGDPSRFFETVEASENPSQVTILAHRNLPAGSGNAAWRHYTITCKSLGRQRIRIRVGNTQTSTNPSPVVSEKSVDFICSTPSALFIYPTFVPLVSGSEDIPTDCAEAMSKLVMTSQKGSVGRLSHDFRLRNQREVEFTLAVFDGDGNRFHNFSSLAVQWASSDLANLNLKEVEKKSELAGAIRIYSDSRIASLSSKEVEVSVRIQIQGYVSATLDKSAVDRTDRSKTWPAIDVSFRFSLYNPLRIEPQRASVYLHPSNAISLRAVSGSGHIYHQTNSSEIARISQGTEEVNSLHVVPLSEGVLAVSVSDRCLPTDTVSSTVFISDVHAVNIRARDLVEVDTPIDMTIQALDFYGNIFPEDQYRFLNLTVRDDGSGILRVVPKGSAKATSFAIHGSSVGYSTLTVTVAVKSKAQTISSEPHGVHVFPRFKLIPDQLVLVPGATFKLQWTGMVPQRAQVTFTTEDKTTIRLDSQSGQVDALVIGKAKVIAVAYAHHATEPAPFEVGRDQREISVRYLDQLRISSSSNRMQVGSEQVLTVIGASNEPPFAWGNMDVRFEWSVSNSRIAALAPLYRNVSLEEESSFAVRINAVSAGRCEVRVRVISAPAQSRLNGLSATFTLEVTEPLRLLSPSDLLLAPGSRFQIHTNYDHNPQHSLCYELLRDMNCEGNPTAPEIVRVTSKGEIVAANGAGSAYVLVSDTNSGYSSLGQSAVVKVVVKPVQHLSLSPHFNALQLGVGSQQRLAVQMRDERGQLFNAFDAIALTHMLNVDQVVGVSIVRAPNNASNADVVLSGLGPGKAILQVNTDESSSPQHRLATYLPIEVTNAIEPSELALHVGGSGQFTTHFARDIGPHKRPWSSSDPNIVAVDAETGKLRAVAPGSAQIFHNSTVHTRATVTVVKVDALEAADPSLRFISDRSFTLSLPLRFISRGSELNDTMNAHHNVELDCSAVLPPFVTLEAHRATLSSRAKCVFTFTVANSSSIALSDALRSLDRDPLPVTATAGSAPMIVSRTFSVPIAPLFVVPQEDVKLGGASLDSTTVMVKVDWRNTPSSLRTPLTIENSRASLLQVHTVPEQSSGSFDVIHVGLRGAASTTASFSNVDIKIINPATGQVAHVSVSYDKQALVARAAHDLDAARAAASYSAFSLTSNFLIAVGIAVILSLVVLVVALWRVNTSIVASAAPAGSSNPPPTPAPANPFASANVPPSTVKPTPNIFKGKTYGSPPATSSSSSVFSPMGLTSPGGLTSPYRPAKKPDNPFQ